MTPAVQEAVLAGGLGVFAVLLAGPLSSRLAAAAWIRRAPRAALVLWQAVCLGAGLALVGAALVPAVAPLGDNIATALGAGWRNLLRGRPFERLAGWQIGFGLVAAAMAGMMLAVLMRCFLLALRCRAAHRGLLDLLAGARPVVPVDQKLLAGVRVVDHRSAIAYTVPGWHSRVVLSAGLVDLLTPAEVAAVLEHERAHLRSRHDLLILPFQAWSASWGAIPGVRRAGESVPMLTEMLADGLAARRVGAAVLASALAKVTIAGGAAGAGGGAAADRTSGSNGEQSPGGCAGRAAVGREGPLAGATERPAGRIGGAVALRLDRLRRTDVLPASRTAVVYLAALMILAVPTAALLIGWR